MKRIIRTGVSILGLLLVSQTVTHTAGGAAKESTMEVRGIVRYAQQPLC